MLKRGGVIVLLLCAVIAAGAAADKKKDGKPPADDAEHAAQQFVDLLAAGEFSKAVERFDDTMKEALPEAKLSEVWKKLNTQVGPFQKRTGVRTEKQAPYTIVFVTCRFENAVLDTKVVFGAAGRIAGLFFVPHETGAAYTPPGYARPGAYREVEVTVGTGRTALPGTLATPVGPGTFAGVVLVHGSGPHDRDETIGPNKPFLDLAAGLASRGVAVLRYDKRTMAHAAEVAADLERLTLEEETIGDALAAVRSLRASERIDAERIFVLGHSLGGVAAPRIGARDQRIAGLILMATPSRPLRDVLVDQFAYLFDRDGEVTPDEQARLDQIRAQVGIVKDPVRLAAAAPGDLPFGMGRAYWSYLERYDAPEVAAGLSQPVLVLQGGRDYQVTGEDLEGWRRALAGRAGVTFRVYPDLNHLFMTGEGRSTPEEYETAGNVAAVVVEDVAAWILGQPGTGRDLG
jgi:dienelactone hydrolase